MKKCMHYSCGTLGKRLLERQGRQENNIRIDVSSVNISGFSISCADPSAYTARLTSLSE